jgi:hypothetical protein
MKFEKLISPISGTDRAIDPIAEAEVYYTYGKFQQAFMCMFDALKSMKESKGAVVFDEYLHLAKHVYTLCVERSIQNFAPSFVAKYIIDIFPNCSSFHTRLEEMINTVNCIGSTSVDEIDSATRKIVDMLKKNIESKPAVNLKEMMIDRLIQLSKGTDLPGFNDEPEKIREKFMNMPDDLFMTMFELIIVQAHRDGHQ